MMDLLVAHGANVNAEWHGEYPIIYSACEAVDPVALKWLLEHGANPNCDTLTRPYADTALDYVIGSVHPARRSCAPVSTFWRKRAAARSVRPRCWTCFGVTSLVCPSGSMPLPRWSTNGSRRWSSARPAHGC